MVVVIAQYAIDEVESQFEFYLFGHFTQQRVLSLCRKLRKHEIPFRLPFTPDIFKGTGIELRVCHEVHRNQGAFVIREIPLAVLAGRHFLALLKHLSRFHAGKEIRFLHTRFHVDQSLLY